MSASTLKLRWKQLTTVLVFAGVISSTTPERVNAQVAPSPAERSAYRGLFAAAARNDARTIAALLTAKRTPKYNPNARDPRGRTPLMVAAHFSNDRAALALLRGGADPNLLDADRYDMITIASVTNDAAMVRLAIANGGKATNITSRWDGTALIAAAHLGNVEAIRELLRGGPPLDHINNLGWTALLEAVILGDGGERHQAVVRMLLDAGADQRIADRNGDTPLDHATTRGYTAMVQLFGR